MGIGLLLVLALPGACSSSTSNDQTSPSMRAMLVVDGDPIVFCTDSCVFEGRASNFGLGCAGRVRGTTTVRATSGRILGQVSWRLADSWIVEPGTSFLYDGCCFHTEIRQQEARYETALQWDNVRCPAG